MNFAQASVDLDPVQRVTEKWRLHCLRCSRMWEEMYDARYCGDAITWSLKGTPAQPPWIDRTCSKCGSLRVKVLPAGPVVRRDEAR
jgi:hypothetical protein